MCCMYLVDRLVGVEVWKERNRVAKNSVCPIVTQDNAQGCGVMYRDCDCIGSMLRRREGSTI